MTTLSDRLDEGSLRDLAGDRSFQRGVNYLEEGRVHALAQYGDRITAKVYGTHTYKVDLWLEADDLEYTCTCPLGDEGLFCKHCVAVGLAWIAEPPPYYPASDVPALAHRQGYADMQAVHDYLARQAPETLVQMILDRAMNDDRWRQQLLLLVAAKGGQKPDIDQVRRSLIDALVPDDDYIEYDEVDGYVEDIETVLASMTDLVKAGYADEVIDLCELAVSLLEEAFECVDDSSGYVSRVAESIQDLHHQACLAGQPDPTDLAKRLFELETRSDYGLFYNAIATYAEVLGEAGLATYEALVDKEWRQFPNLDHEDINHYDSRRSQISQMKEAIARHRGNLEELVNVIGKDLSQPGRYVAIAELYWEAGQLETAIEWAEQGMAVFAQSYRTDQLTTFLIHAYEQGDRFEDAVTIVWQDFSRSPTLSNYQRLKVQAEKAQSWPQWRDRALAHLLHLMEHPPANAYTHYPPHNDGSLLVEVLLWEGESESAWETAQTQGCNQKLWLRLADQRAKTHPADVPAIYQPAIDSLINQMNNDAYAQAVDLLLKLKAVMTQLDQAAEFQTFVTSLSHTHKRKRNFTKLLNHQGLI